MASEHKNNHRRWALLIAFFAKIGKCYIPFSVKYRLSLRTTKEHWKARPVYISKKHREPFRAELHFAYDP